MGDGELKTVTAYELNERIFMLFPLGWVVGVIAGSVYAGFNWGDLQHELGRTLLIAVTTSQATTLIGTMVVFRRMFSKAPDEPHDDEE